MPPLVIGKALIIVISTTNYTETVVETKKHSIFNVRLQGVRMRGCDIEIEVEI